MGSVRQDLKAWGLALGLVFALAGAADAGCDPERVDLRGSQGVVQVHVELARTPEERAKGLMMRDKLAASAGMLFIFDHPVHARFWMKDTLIPLDMIFADPTGTVTAVHENAVPQDLTPIDGGEGVGFVLEINGGLARRMGIAPGAVLRHPAIEQTRAAWSCAASQ